MLLLYYISGTANTLQKFILLIRRVKKQYDITRTLKAVNCTVSFSLQDKMYALEELHGQYSVYIMMSVHILSSNTNRQTPMNRRL